MKTSTTEKAAAIETLKQHLSPGDTVYTVLRHCSSSGMMRVVDVYAMKDNNPVRLTWSAAQAIGWTYNRKHEGIQLSGCGMDMGFHAVYSISRVLFPDGFGIEGELPLGRKIRPKTRAMAAKAVSKGAIFHGRNGVDTGWDNDGGYALNHRWM